MRSQRRAIRGLLVLAAGIALVLGTGPARAEVRRMEAVGAVPVDRDDGLAPRDAAILQAQKEAVRRVGNELLIDAEIPEGPDGAPQQVDVDQVLGSDLARFTSRFRILEDRGERPTAFGAAASGGNEYVMVVEVHVDVDRVRARLEEAGVLRASSAPIAQGRIRLDVRGLGSWGAFQALRELALGGGGARSVQPVELARGRALLEVETEDEPERFVRKLLDSAPPELEIQEQPGGGDVLRLTVRWTPPPPAADRR